MKPLVIIKLGDTFPQLAARHGDFENWIEAGISRLHVPVEVIDPRQDLPLPPNEDIAGAIVTGSHAMVTDYSPWSATTAFWLYKLVLHGIPVLGICYGHQLLAHALGGEVGYHPQGMEIGTVPVRRTAAAATDRLFKDLPDEFPVQVVHRQSVRKLPRGAVLLAGNEFEPHQAFRVGNSAWGTQFHPEFSSAAMAGYIAHLGADLEREGRDPRRLQEQVTPTAAASRILHGFGTLVAERQGCFA
ncbi:GMP synthase (glutamine-hydrolysing) [Paucimonas lemoignei]|uniref:GMP synthase (Glutamine-hydrolysing) n=1 Tax=Paucimonas lemoignei TaxID=29443 RepID=A0A4R3HY09_PAULE|nr:glutamine amidotransferase [Paucimonas lemoignei]TCS37523.1 GMP synthase (glutamine-hydrolysing) [Paucimonas lemoignei]